MDKDKLRINITKFLQWNNRNGYYSIEECDLEEESRMTYEEEIKYAKDNRFYNNTYEKLMLLVENENPTEEFYRSLI